MKQHLLDLVEELKNEGYNESDAIELAIHRFGDKNSLKKDLTYFFKYPKKVFIVKIMVMIGIILCLLTLFAKDIGYGHDLEKCDINNIDNYIKNKHISYLRVFEISNDSDINLDDLRVLTNEKEINSKKIKLIYSYGDFDKSSYMKAVIYDEGIPMWYIEYVTKSTEVLKINVKILICVSILFILIFIYIYIYMQK